MAKKVHACQTCGSLVEEPGHLCNPEGEPMTCVYCGEDGSFAKHYCQGKLEDISYVCEQCDRLATSAKLLCKPTRVPKS